MRLLSAFLGLLLLPQAALAQGTKDPSSPTPNMVFPVQPPSGPSQPTTVPNRSYYSYPYYPRPTPRLRRIGRDRARVTTR
jgi:hypothetical protein